MHVHAVHIHTLILNFFKYYAIYKSQSNSEICTSMTLYKAYSIGNCKEIYDQWLQKSSSQN